MRKDIYAGKSRYSSAPLAWATLVLAAGVLSGCGQEKKYRWKDRMPTVDCTPRTARAKAQLGGCPKLADYQHPTMEEQREFVDYMNRKNAIEGTIIFGDYYPPGCLTWSVDPGTAVPKSTPVKKQGCSEDLEKKLQNFSVP